MKNFRRFDKQEMNFSPQFNVLVGKNGSGKTTILDALSVAMGAWLLGMARFNKDCKARSIGITTLEDHNKLERYEKSCRLKDFLENSRKSNPNAKHGSMNSVCRWF